MKDKAFLDTNILIYAIDNSSAYRRKQEIARGLIDSHIRKETGVISIQVLQEFIITATNKIKAPLSSEEALEFIRYLSILEIVQPDFDMVVSAVQLQKRHRLSFYDSMIIQAAKTAECILLLSEDLQPGFRIGSLIVRDPFAN